MTEKKCGLSPINYWITKTMSEKPFEKLLHRELQKHDVEKNFTPQLEMLRDVVNYGTNLIPAAFASSKGEVEDVVIIPVLLKQVVRMLDSFEVLTSNGCVPASVLQARAAFEASVNIDWVLKEDSKKRALYYYVSNLRRGAIWALRAVEGDDEHTDFMETLGEFGEELKDSHKRMEDDVKLHADEVKELLSKPPYAEINSEFDRVRGRRTYDPNWHEPLGVSSFRAMSKEVGRLHEYAIFYSQFSETMHSSYIKEHVSISNGRVEFEPIRNLDKIDTLINFSACVAFHAYQVILRKYRPGQEKEFARRYKDDWREAFMNIPTIEYNVIIE